MKKSLYLSIAFISFIPFLAYISFQIVNPCDPDFVIIKKPSLFAAKWEKVAYSENFSEYIDPTRVEKNLDTTVEVVTMRNYFKSQIDNDIDSGQSYKSHVSYETVDCFNQTITVNKMYLLGDHFTKGSLVEEPIEPNSTPIRVNPRSVGFSKMIKVCGLAHENFDPGYMKSSFMNNI